MDKKSSGVVLVRFENNTPYVLLMRFQNYWDFPKGGIEEKENKLNAALREVKEETGINDVYFKWGKVFYETEKYGKDNKTAFYFVAETKTKDVFIEANPISGIKEHEEYRWVKINEARLMTVPRIKKVLDWVEKRIILN